MTSDDGWKALRPAAAAIASVTVEFPDDFAYSNFTESGFVAAFAGTAPAKAIQILTAPGIPFEIVEDVGYSSRQLETSVTEIAEAVRVSRDGKTSFEVAAVPDEGTVQVTFYGDEALRDSISSSAELSPSSLGLVTDFVTAEGTTATSSYGRAGGTWLIDGAGQGQCTSGFVVKSTSSDALGVLTAGHCPDALRYFQPVTGENYWMNFVNGTFGASGDAQFHRSPVMMDAWFHADLGVGKPVLDARNPVQDEVVCRFGMATATDLCGPVQAVITSVYYGASGISVGGVARADLWNTPGDSGGPVYGGNTAMGLMSGTRFLANGQIDMTANRALWFTKMDNAEAITGTRVCLEPVCRW